jgi:hypothetical protein
MTWTGKSRLVKEGYALSEINKLQTMKEAACHRNRRKRERMH